MLDLVYLLDGASEICSDMGPILRLVGIVVWGIKVIVPILLIVIGMIDLAKAVSEKSLVVLNYLNSIGDENVTAADIAAALGMEKKSVDGIVTSGLIRNKGYAERIPAEVLLEDGTHKQVKFIKSTAAGKAYDHEAAKA